MQEISVILAHPYGGSLNAAIAQTVAATLRSNGYQVNFHDLDQEKFNPVMSAEELAGDHTNDNLLKCHQQEIMRADGIIIIHPNWWGAATRHLERLGRQGTAPAHRLHLP